MSRFGFRPSLAHFIRGLILSIVGLLASQGTFAVDANAMVEVDIPAQSLSSALVEFGRQTGVQVMTAASDVGDLRSSAVRGKLHLGDALNRLLQGTHLQYQDAGPNSVVIAKPVTSGEADSQKEELQEIVVTAQKRVESLHDVPVPVTVLNTTALTENGQYRIQDYFATVPGLNFSGNTEGGGTQFITIRGLATGAYETPAVAVVIDDVPFGNSSALNFGSETYPDIDPGDLERIEVLRGPQGTLYGADSIGGIIKFVPREPSTDALSGNVDVQGVDIPSGGAGYAVHAGVNIPLSESLAVRVSGFSRQDPGYVENVTTGQRDINVAQVRGGLLTALWNVSDNTSLKLGVLSQDTDGSGSPLINSTASFQPALGDYQQTGLRGTGSYENSDRLYWATLKTDLGGLDLTSVSGYGLNSYRNLYDLTTLFGAAAQSTFGVPGVGGTDNYQARKFSQEFRLSSPVGPRLDWLAGLFYTHEDNPGVETFLAKQVVSGATAGTLATFNDPVRLTEYALFGDVTYHVTSKFDIQVGGRASENRQAFYNTITGPMVPALYGESSPYVEPTPHSEGHSVTYLITPKLNLTPDMMLYARIATGYRLGGPVLDGGTLGLPLTYKPDTTTDYELGLKWDLFSHSVSLDVSAYYIDWKDIQFSLTDALGSTYVANGGTARSQGLEVSIDAHPIDGLRIITALSVNDAELTQSLPPESTAYGLSGARLPYSTPFSGSVTVDQDFAHVAGATLSAGGSVMYIGRPQGRVCARRGHATFQFPGYTTLNARLGARYQMWHFLLFVNNLADSRGIVGGQSVYEVGNPSGLAEVITQPRTLGLSASRQF